MNPNNDKLQTLLDEVVPPSGGPSGPSGADVSAMVRHERARRLRLRGSAALLAVVILVSVALPWRGNTPPNPPRLVEARSAPAPVVFREVNDEQLLVLLKDTPAALMEWPNGDRTLIVINRR